MASPLLSDFADGFRLWLGTQFLAFRGVINRSANIGICDLRQVRLIAADWALKLGTLEKGL